MQNLKATQTLTSNISADLVLAVCECGDIFSGVLASLAWLIFWTWMFLLLTSLAAW